jgi:hypothetical protein
MSGPHAALRKIVLDASLGVDARARDVAACLDRLPTREKIAALESLGGVRCQRRLWEAAATNPPIRTADLVGHGHAPMTPVVFHGRNSLPAFSDFRKICCRPPASTAEDVLWGYNDTSIRRVIGPGYYVVHDTPGHAFGGCAFDYTALPPDRPPQWPEIRGNDVGLSRFIYNGTVDYMRRVAKDVFIGSATRKGRELGSYFVLVRELPSPSERSA